LQESSTGDGAPLFLALEGLRGILALSVAFGHFNFGTWLTPFGLAYNFQMAVDVFFMLSGFVLTHSNYAVPSRVSFAGFAVKRFARLYPLHILTVGVMTGLYMLQGAEFGPGAAVRQILIVHGDNFGKPHFNAPSWSISVEIWCALAFYVVMRSYAAGGRVSRSLWLLAASATVATAALLLHAIVFDDPSRSWWPGWGNYLRGAAGFCLGIVAYFTFVRLNQQPHWFVLAVAWLCTLVVTAFFLGAWPPGMAGLFYVASFGMIVTLAAAPAALPVLESRVCVWLGTISYSIYLIHDVLYAVLAYFAGPQAVKGVAGKAILLPLLLLVAHATYTWFERPAQRFIRRIALGSVRT
jgi:peptidoglycan/LPS O-acetylase OafA/YrhL